MPDPTPDGGGGTAATGLEGDVKAEPEMEAPIKMEASDIQEQPCPSKKKARRHKKKTSDRREYVMESKKEKEAEAREKRQHFEYLEAEKRQEERYLAAIAKQLLKEAHPDIKPSKKKSSSKATKKTKSKGTKKRPRVGSGGSDWEDGDLYRVDDSDDVTIVKVVPSAASRQPSSTDPICIDDDDEEIPPRAPQRRPRQGRASKSLVPRVAEQLQRPTQFRLAVVKSSFHHEHKIQFELTEEEYELLLNDAHREKCPGHAGVLKGEFPPAPTAALCSACHSMMFFYHCQQAIIAPTTTERGH